MQQRSFKIVANTPPLNQEKKFINGIKFEDIYYKDFFSHWANQIYWFKTSDINTWESSLGRNQTENSTKL